MNKIFIILILFVVINGLKTEVSAQITTTKKLEVNSGKISSTGIKLTPTKGELTSESLATINSATGIAFDNNGNLYVTNFNENKIHKITPNGTISDFVTLLDGPHDIIFGPDNYLYVSNFFGNTVLQISLIGAVSPYGSGYSTPIGLTFDKSGNLFVVNSGTGNISKVNSAGTVVSHSFATGLTSPYNCVFDSLTNNIFVSNYGANEVARVNATTGGAKVTFKSGVTACTGITLNSNGIILVAQASPNKVSQISPDAVMTDYVNTTYPFDILMDTNDNLFVANQTIHSVSKFSPNFYNSLLAVNAVGEVKSTSLSKNGYKLYLDESTNNAPAGIHIRATGIGLRAESLSDNAIYAESVNKRAIYGKSNIGVGLYGESIAGAGVSGISYSNYGVFGSTATGTGVIGICNSSTGIAIHGVALRGLAGYFDGGVVVKGNLCAANVACPSDIRLKRNFIPLSSSLNKLSSVIGYHYYWKDSTQSKNLQTGVIAQELQKYFPELVNTERDGFLSVNYTGLIPHLIEAVKELNNNNSILQEKNAKLAAKNGELEKLFNQLKNDFSTRLEAIEATLKTPSGK